MSNSSRVTALVDAPRACTDPPPYDPPQHWPELSRLPDAGSGTTGEVYHAVRRMLVAAGLDFAHRETARWNPFGDLVLPGAHIVLKPNWVRHFNPCPDGTLESVVTHAALIRAVCDYALLAVGVGGRVIVADAPQHDCDFDVLRAQAGIEALEQHYRRHGLPVEFRDLRQEAVTFADGVVTDRIGLDGDPEGYTEIDLGDASAFADVPGRSPRLRGADYDERETVRHHSGGIHRYLISNTILGADLVINLPKIKSHKKAGLTCCLKNLVGINGNKNYLPHHTTGFPDRDGDEFAELNLYTWSRRRAVEWARRRLASGKSVKLIRSMRRVEARTHSGEVIRSGNWYGNDTIWRTVLDLNTILRYVDRTGRMQPEPFRQRTIFHIAEGMVAGGGEGPLAPRDVPAGLLVCGHDPVRVDAVVAALVGFDWRRIPSIERAVQRRSLAITEPVDPRDAFVRLHYGDEILCCTLAETPAVVKLPAHPGWLNRIERVPAERKAHEASLAG